MTSVIGVGLLPRQASGDKISVVFTPSSPAPLVAPRNLAPAAVRNSVGLRPSSVPNCRTANQTNGRTLLMKFPAIGSGQECSRDLAVVMLIGFVVCFIPLLIVILHLIHQVERELASNW
jgi:hypothetical protein